MSPDPQADDVDEVAKWAESVRQLVGADKLKQAILELEASPSPEVTNDAVTLQQRLTYLDRTQRSGRMTAAEEKAGRSAIGRDILTTLDAYLDERDPVRPANPPPDGAPGGRRDRAPAPWTERVPVVARWALLAGLGIGLVLGYVASLWAVVERREPALVVGPFVTEIAAESIHSKTPEPSPTPLPQAVLSLDGRILNPRLGGYTLMPEETVLIEVQPSTAGRLLWEVFPEKAGNFTEGDNGSVVAFTPRADPGTAGFVRICRYDARANDLCVPGTLLDVHFRIDVSQ